MIEVNIQERFLELILERYPRRADAVEKLSELLNCGKDSVYRRLRGDTLLSPQELGLLANYYSISLDELIFGPSDRVVCTFNAFSKQIKGYEQYLEDFIDDLKKIRRLPDPHFYYASVEIPLLTYSFFEELISFKLYVWGRTTWNLNFLKDRPFDFQLFTAPMRRLNEELLEHYIALQSTEIWSVNIVDNTLAQIEYHVYSGGFSNPKDALLLCDRLHDWANHLKAMATAGKKFAANEKPESGRGVLQVYHNEMVHTNNTALITSDLGKFVYTSFCNPNFIKSSDHKLCSYTEDWFHIVISKSNPITLSAEKSRDWFFKELTKRIDRVKNRIQLHLDEG